MNRISLTRIDEFLEAKAKLYNHPDFIATDPIQVPGSFSKKEDMEISGFLTAVISWGQRKTIISNAKKLMALMDDAPFDFIQNHRDKDLQPLSNFVHRTFNGDDVLAFVAGLKRLYAEEGGLELCLSDCFCSDAVAPGSGWNTFKKKFFDIPHLKRTEKHLPDPLKGSAAKRMNMFLRWMVRSDENGVDFGLWNSMEPRQLYIPLDVHTARVARKLKLLRRKQNDWKAVLELNQRLKEMDPTDPVKYDFALFGLGVFEKF